MSEFDRRLLPNYIFAGATIGVFLFAAVYGLLNADTLITEIPQLEPGTALVVGGVGGTLITALIVVTKDVYAYFFRKNPE